MNQTRRNIPILKPLAYALIATAGVPAWVHAQAGNAQGKISRNFYRIPYSSGQPITMNQDYVDHGNTPAGDFGSMDMTSSSGNTRFIVAAAAGTVIAVNDTLNGCGCHAAYSACANTVQIQHANGEVSNYLHIAQGSATAQGIANNVNVVAGQIIGIEGDVGWTCGGGSAPRASPACGVNSVPPNTGNCGPHLHWNVVQTNIGQGTNPERVNPMTCAITNNLYADNGNYTSAACTTAGCPTNNSVSNLTLNSFGEWRVFQADDQVTASTVTVTNLGSLVLHAGNSVRMLPGFLANAGGYTRAEIGACNTTAFVPPGAPAPALERPVLPDLSSETAGY